MIVDEPAWVCRTREGLASIGLNVVGIAEGAAYESLLPGCRSVLVFGSGGGALWEAFMAAAAAEPSRLTDEQHPLDRFVDRAIAEVDACPPSSRRWIRCAADETTVVDFRTLAWRAGIGWPSALGLLLHPIYGPWLGLRAACLTREVLPPTPLPSETGPCESCAAPCATACPASAIALPFRQREGGGGWQVDRCARWNQENEACRSECAARMACPVGAKFRYSPLERHYHQDRRTGRRALAAALRIVDARVGIGPDWGAWGDRS